MKFSYCDEGCAKKLILKADRMEVHIFFDNGDPEWLWASDLEFEALDDRLSDFSIMVQGKSYTLHQILMEASCQFDEIENEVRIEDAANAEMYRELSCPYATGRI